MPRNEHARKQPTLDDHPGLDADEATERGRMMTGLGSVGSGRDGESGASTTDEPEGPPTLDDHPGLDADETTAEGEMMTASGSTGPRHRDAGDEAHDGKR
jgi:hypothetical protein